MTILEYRSRVWDMLIERIGGAMTFRLVVQPVVASIIAIRAGIRDAKEGHPPYFWSWSVLTHAPSRAGMMRSGWRDIGKVFFVAIALDVIYGLWQYHGIFPIQTLIVATVLAILPYLLVRGPVTKLFSLFVQKYRNRECIQNRSGTNDISEINTALKAPAYKE